MECLFRRNWFTSVRRGSGELLEGETSYVDTNRELVARLRVGVTDFLIREAEWEAQRPIPPGAKVLPVPVLQGKEAYFNAGSALRELAMATDEPLQVPLFAETIKGVIQAETFLWEERGFSSAEAYEQRWSEGYEGVCHYYSNPDRVTRKWFQHTGETTREGNLFVRFKTQTIYSLENGRFLLSGHLTDSFHHVSVQLTLGPEWEVEKAEGALIRVPDPVCEESSRLLENLVGVKVKGLRKKEIATLLGAGQGCVHLIDLTFDAVQILDFI